MLPLWHLSCNERDVENRKRSSYVVVIQIAQTLSNTCRLQACRGQSITLPSARLWERPFELDKASANFGHTGHRCHRLACYGHLQPHILLIAACLSLLEGWYLYLQFSLAVLALDLAVKQQSYHLLDASSSKHSHEKHVRGWCSSERKLRFRNCGCFM